MKILHPSDANLINLYSISTTTKLSVVRDEKNYKILDFKLSPCSESCMLSSG